MELYFPFGIQQQASMYVFYATQNILKGTLLESCPTIPLSLHVVTHIQQTKLAPYVIQERGRWYVPFGYMGYLSCALDGNVQRTGIQQGNTFNYRTIRDIQAGELLLLDENDISVHVNMDMNRYSQGELSDITQISLPFVVGMSDILHIRGIVSSRYLPKGTVLEVCPIITFSFMDVLEIDKTVLQNYIFEYGKNYSAFAFGYGSLMNHSYDPNAFVRVLTEGWITFISKKNIEPGEEITITYGGLDKRGNTNRIRPQYFDFDRQIR